MISLMVVADIRLYIEGLTRLLNSIDGIEVVAAAGTCEDALEQLAKFSPNFLLVDIAMADGIELISRIRLSDKSIKAIALTVEEVEQDLITCAEAGIAGYVTRDATIEDLIDTIRAAEVGELRCTPKAAGLLLKSVSRYAALRHPLGVLTSREVEVLDFVEQGMSNGQISQVLGIEMATVKNHIHNILEKLHVKRRGEAAALFRRQAAASKGSPVLLR